MSAPRAYTRNDFVPYSGPRPSYIKGTGDIRPTAEARLNLITGRVVTRRGYQEQIGKPLPAKVSDRPSLYTKVARRWAADHAQTKMQARKDPRLQLLWRRLRAMWNAEQRGVVIDRSPNSEMADVMRQLNMKHDTQYWVGETP